MSLRRPGLALAALLVFAVAFPISTRARARFVPRPAFSAHEWGVWLIDGGAVTVTDLARESPPFVHRAPQAVVSTPTPTSPRPPPQVDTSPAVARKPVLFFHTEADRIPVSVQVGFRGGRPWLFYPGGVTARVGTNDGLSFSGTIVRGRAELPSVARGHFWRDMRAASDTTFLAGNGESEAFIFYDGPSEVVRPSVTRVGDAVTVRVEGDEQTVFVVSDGRYTRARVAPTATVDLAAIARTGERARTLERAFVTVLVERGLTRAEATSLVRTWRHELVEETRAHVISIVPRVAYDAALPLTIFPPPSEIVRVGVIVERL